MWQNFGSHDGTGTDHIPDCWNCPGCGIQEDLPETDRQESPEENKRRAYYGGETQHVC